MNITPITLKGERSLLVPISRDHVAGLFAAGSHPEIWTYIPNTMTSEEEMREMVEYALAAQATGSQLVFTIIDQATDTIVGSTRLYDIDTKNKNVEIGSTWHSPDVWRTRINTECKYLLLQHCFETLGTIRVALRTDARNERSQRAIERIGAKKEGILRHHRIMPDGYLRDTVYYSILAEEWPSVKVRLLNMLEQYND